MSSDTWLRVLSLCVLLASAETLHGIARTLLVVPRIGKEKALKLSALTGSLLAFAICAAWVPPIGLGSLQDHLVLGVVLAAFMAGFDIAMGMLLMRKRWAKVKLDFDPRTGNYLSFAIVFLACVPALVYLLGWGR